MTEEGQNKLKEIRRRIADHWHKQKDAKVIGVGYDPLAKSHGRVAKDGKSTDLPCYYCDDEGCPMCDCGCPLYSQWLNSRDRFE